MSLNVLSRELILTKKDVLISRIYKVAVLSALAGAAPVPGLDIAVDTLVLLEEAIFYRSQFGLDEDSLRNHAKLHRMSLDDFIERVGLESSMVEFSKTGIIMYLSKIGVTSAASYATKNILKYTLPVVGNIISGTAAYTSATYCLNSILDMMVNDALKINDYRPKE
ncbi:interferon-inducible GTPase 5-like [Mercenaria mercenaria]|uniref:interferon-inducible GTPase 5-like n=1 Tax=Mercenaria mercenaria TaxID=6596 RepID=UPI00234F9255|nr:interferon-inducible GTPase 5-like [Mercenaria mercenaria]